MYTKQFELNSDELDLGINQDFTVVTTIIADDVTIESVWMYKAGTFDNPVKVDLNKLPQDYYDEIETIVNNEHDSRDRF